MYEFTTCLTDIVGNEPLANLNFAIYNTDIISELIDVKNTKSDGCMTWHEQIQVDLSNTKYNELLLKRSIHGQDLIRGSVNLRLVINPWQDVAKSGGPAVVDYTNQADFKEDKYITNSTYSKEIAATRGKNNIIVKNENSHFKLDAISINKTDFETWDVSNALHAEITKSYKMDLNLKYKIPVPPDGFSNEYAVVRDATYRVKATFLSSYSTEQEFGKYKNSERKVYISTDEQVADSTDGTINVRYLNIKISDLTMLQTRSLLLIDIEAIAGNQFMLEIPKARFVATIILDEKESDINSVRPLKKEEYVGVRKEFQKYLDMSFSTLQAKETEQNTSFKESIAKLDSPTLYTKNNNLDYINFNHVKVDNEPLNFLKSIFTKFYTRTPLAIVDYAGLCRHWAYHMYKDKYEENNSQDFRNKLNFSCLQGLNLPTPRGQAFNPDVFQIRPMWMQLKPGKEAQPHEAHSPVFNIGTSFASKLVDATIEDGFEKRHFGTLSSPFPIISAGMTGGYFSGYHKEKLSGVSVHTNNVNFMTMQQKRVVFTTTELQRCISLKIDSTAMYKIVERAATPTFPKVKDMDDESMMRKLVQLAFTYDFPKALGEMLDRSPRPWMPEDNGYLLCENKLELSEGLKLEDRYYYLKQLFRDSSGLVDKNKSENLTWTLSLRGETQFEDLTHFLNMKEDPGMIGAKPKGPSEQLLDAYEGFKRTSLPIYPGVFIPSEEEIERLERIHPFQY